MTHSQFPVLCSFPKWCIVPIGEAPSGSITQGVPHALRDPCPVGSAPSFRFRPQGWAAGWPGASATICRLPAAGPSAWPSSLSSAGRTELSTPGWPGQCYFGPSARLRADPHTGPQVQFLSGIYLGYGFDPRWGHVGEGTGRCFTLTPRSLCLPSPLSRSSKQSWAED